MALLASRAVEEPVAVHGVVARQHEPSPVSRQVGVDLARQEGTAIELVRVAAREVVAKEAAARVAARDVCAGRPEQRGGDGREPGRNCDGEHAVDEPVNLRAWSHVAWC